MIKQLLMLELQLFKYFNFNCWLSAFVAAAVVVVISAECVNKLLSCSKETSSGRQSHCVASAQLR